MNRLRYSWLLVIVVLCVLCMLHWLPSIVIGGHRLRNVDLLSDVRPERIIPDTLSLDTLPLLPPVDSVFIDTCPYGMTCIVDYADSSRRNMDFFYQALDEAVSRPVRIAFFGDSFVEADILTADLRAMFQQRFGGCGVGYVSITSPINGFRPTVRHTFDGWESHVSTDTIGFDPNLQDLSGRYFIPEGKAWVEFRGQRKYASLLDTCQVSTLYLWPRDTVRISCSINDGYQDTLRCILPSDERVIALKKRGQIGRIRWQVLQPDTSCYYGIAMDGEKGCVVDNFSMRGSSGMTLSSLPGSMLAAFNRVRPYDLIILQYGLNVVSEKVSNYDYYEKGMVRTIRYLQEYFPQASILLLSVGDRDYKTDEGDIRTMPSIRRLIHYQQRAAVSTGVAFWNMFEAMGGNESMAALATSNPPQANLDYTHINFRGGKFLAELLYEALLHGKEQYDRRREYDGR